MNKERPLVADLVKSQRLPRMFPVRQRFDRTRIVPEEIPDRIQALLSEERIAGSIRPGMRIAITAGSREIANIALIVKCVAGFVKSHGGSPFIVPAMGSHGGATAQGQRETIEGYGITEQYVGCPILSSMEVKEIGTTEDGRPVFIDRHAAEADGIIVVCRIKPHTAFRGPYESGIMKMLAIGLGKQHGAQVCHEAGFQNMAENVPMFGRAVLANAPILFALSVLENAYDETCRIEAVHTRDVAVREPELLKEAYHHMPRILVDECDVLIVDEIGKNYSGDGMDPNVTGRFCTPYADGGICAQRVCVLDLSDKTHGNGIGIGLADVTTSRLYHKLDLAAMYPNAITCTVLSNANIPLIMESDREAIQVCVQTCTEIDKAKPRIVRIPNTLHLEHIMMSEVFYQEVKCHPDLEIEGEPEYLSFDEEGNLW